MLAACQGYMAIVTALLEAGAEVDTVDDQGDTALICAAHKGYLAIVTALLEAGAEVDTVNDNGKKISSEFKP
jgi:ankyrin repeat protein